MDQIVDKLAQRLANSTSRRGFLGKLGKAALGAAAVAAGVAAGSGVAFAAVDLRCCTGTGCPSFTCPSGTHAGYSWTCCVSFDCFHKFQKCQDCFNGSNAYVCTYPIGTATTCPC